MLKKQPVLFDYRYSDNTPAMGVWDQRTVYSRKNGSLFCKLDTGRTDVTLCKNPACDNGWLKSVYGAPVDHYHCVIVGTKTKAEADADMASLFKPIAFDEAQVQAGLDNLNHAMASFFDAFKPPRSENDT